MLNSRLFLCLALGVVSVCPYIAGLNHAFVYDDHGTIVENTYLDNTSHIADVLTLQTIRDPSIIDSGRPAVILTYFVDRALWGLSPTGHHVTNLLLHALAAMLVFIFACRLLHNSCSAAACVLLFVWHPLAVEPVQSPAFREDLLCLCGSVVFLLCMTGSRHGVLRAAVGLAGFMIALLSKESAAVLPLLLGAGYWLFPDWRIADGRLRRFVWASMAAILSAWAWFTFAGQPVQSLGIEWNGLALRGMERVWSLPGLVLWYAVKLLFPAGLSVDYVFRPLTGPGEWPFIAGLCIVLLSCVMIWELRPKRPVISFALCWMLLAFLPVGNVLPLLNPVADRYAYAMLPGFALLVVGAVELLPRPFRRLPFLLAGIYFVLSFLRIGDWKDDETLWRSALAVEPQSARAHTWIGLIKKREGSRMEAWEYFSKAEQLNPHDPVPSINKAVLVGMMGDLADAETRLRGILKKYPDHIAARKNLAHCLRLQGRHAEAETYDAPAAD